jgi:hypothetical protein
MVLLELVLPQSSSVTKLFVLIRPRNKFFDTSTHHLHTGISIGREVCLPLIRLSSCFLRELGRSFCGAPWTNPFSGDIIPALGGVLNAAEFARRHRK